MKEVVNILQKSFFYNNLITKTIFYIQININLCFNISFLTLQFRNHN